MIVVMLVVIPSGRLSCKSLGISREFNCINDCINVGIIFFNSMWKCGFHLANCRHPINFIKVMDVTESKSM